MDSELKESAHSETTAITATTPIAPQEGSSSQLAPPSEPKHEDRQTTTLQAKAQQQPLQPMSIKGMTRNPSAPRGLPPLRKLPVLPPSSVSSLPSTEPKETAEESKSVEMPKGDEGSVRHVSSSAASSSSPPPGQ
jgi:hypothetical protein